VEQGTTDIDHGRVISHAEAKQRMKEWFAHTE
jgi:hypothetical protein